MTIAEFFDSIITNPPYFLRRFLAAEAAAQKAAEEKEAAKKARKAAKTAGVTAESVAPVVASEPKPLGYVWVCEKCKAAPPRYANYPNNYKWKTEKGFLGHKCLG